jgi:hypothetical protein
VIGNDWVGSETQDNLKFEIGNLKFEMETKGKRAGGTSAVRNGSFASTVPGVFVVFAWRAI